MERATILTKSEKTIFKKILERTVKNKVEILMILDYEKNYESSYIAETISIEMMKLNKNICFKYLDIKELKSNDFLKLYNFLSKTIKKGPILTFLKHPNIIFLGFPIGFLFNTFIEELKFISENTRILPNSLIKKISEINRKIDILILTTSICPKSHRVILLSHKPAFINKNLRSVVVEVSQFPELAKKFNISMNSDPKIIIKRGRIEKEISEIPSEESFIEMLSNCLKN
ncbi:MAG: hypothetical protein QXT34_00975 [Candidatus Aenigmatarchaeota archaeon]